MRSIVTYPFGSDALKDLNRRARAVCGPSNAVKWDFHGHQYIVDHGTHKTLNTMIAGQVNVCMTDLPV